MTELNKLDQLPGYLIVRSYLDSRMTRDDFWKRANDGFAEVAKKAAAADAALALLNEHLKGRTYTDLDDALRNMLQAFISYRDADDMCQCGHIRDDHSDLLCKGSDECNCTEFRPAVGMEKRCNSQT